MFASSESDSRESRLASEGEQKNRKGTSAPYAGDAGAPGPVVATEQANRVAAHIVRTVAHTEMGEGAGVKRLRHRLASQVPTLSYGLFPYRELDLFGPAPGQLLNQKGGVSST